MVAWVRRIGIAALVGLAVVIALGWGATAAMSRPLPAGQAGPEAEALAARVAEAIGADGWARTGAVSFRFQDRRYLWDRERNLVRFEDGRGVVLVEGWRPMGRAFRDGAEVGGSYKDRRVRSAYEWFVNDAFWAFAPTKVFDDGVVRSVVATPDGPGLLVSYTSGGVTPGDSYLWELAPDGTPSGWRMWVSVLPVRGAHVEWRAWVTLPTGAKVATVRDFGPFQIEIADLAAAEHLSDLVPGEDPFAPMYAGSGSD